MQKSNEIVQQVLVVEFAGYQFTPEIDSYGDPVTNSNDNIRGVWGTDLIKKQMRLPLSILKEKFQPDEEGKIAEDDLTELKSLIDGMLWPCCLDTGKIWPSMHKDITTSAVNWPNWAGTAEGNNDRSKDITYTLWLETVNEEPLEAE